ncbi:MAG: rRNA maturation RNase YbeY [Acidimicrobiia bacterium]
MTVLVEDEGDSSDLDLEQVRQWVTEVLAAEGYPATAELSVILVSEEGMADLHTHALGKEGPTDVLSFPIENLRPGHVPEETGPPIVIGDVFLAPAYIRRQAEQLEVGEKDELALMVTHGVLHCLGYDHADEADADVMEEKERNLLAGWGMTRR